MADDSQTWGSRKWRALKKQQARLNQANAATPNLDAARAELAAGPKLVVESLEEKLERALPGAFIEDAGPRSASPVSRWRVCRDALLISTGPTRREAIDRAISLRGGR